MQYFGLQFIWWRHDMNTFPALLTLYTTPGESAGGRWISLAAKQSICRLSVMSSGSCDVTVLRCDDLYSLSFHKRKIDQMQIGNYEQLQFFTEKLFPQWYFIWYFWIPFLNPISHRGNTLQYQVIIRQFVRYLLQTTTVCLHVTDGCLGNRRCVAKLHQHLQPSSSLQRHQRSGLMSAYVEIRSVCRCTQQKHAPAHRGSCAATSLRNRHICLWANEPFYLSPLFNLWDKLLSTFLIPLSPIKLPVLNLSQKWNEGHLPFYKANGAEGRLRWLVLSIDLFLSSSFG